MKLHPREVRRDQVDGSTSGGADREHQVAEPAALAHQDELDKVDVPAEISCRAKHFYSIYEKMAKEGP